MDGPSPFQIWLANKLEPRGAKKALAEHLGVRPDAITRLLNWEPGKERRNLDAETLLRIRSYFNEDPPGITVPKREVPVVGHVGAGGEWFLNGTENSSIRAPDYATPHTVAVKIHGDSMGSFLNGWYALYDDIRNPPTEDLIAQPCVVWTGDDRAMVKILRRGSHPGVWTLHSGIGDPIEDVKVIAAAKVLGFERG